MNTTQSTNTTWSQAVAGGMVEWVNEMLKARVAAGMTEAEACAHLTASLQRMG